MPSFLMVLAFGFAVFTSGCGFRPLYGGNRGSLRVPTVYNETSREDLAASLSGALRRNLSSAGYDIVDKPGRTLIVRIVAAEDAPYNITSQGGRLTAVDNEVRVRCFYRLEDARGQPLTDEREVQSSALARGSEDLFSEQGGLQRRYISLADEIARKIAQELAMDGF
jgi:hypothetical protein